MRHGKFVWLRTCLVMVAVGLLTTGCPDEGGTGGPGDTTAPDGYVTLPDGAVVPIDSIDGGCPGKSDPGGDADSDGIPNAFEDKNGDCIIDPTAGETDPNNSDSDGDGLLDGQEDINGDGVIDVAKGEFDPTNPDSNGNGVPDGAESGAVTCTPELFKNIQPSPARFAETNLALPSGYTIADQQDAKAATFQNASGTAFGFVVWNPASSSSAPQEFSQKLLTIAQGGNVPVVLFQENFAIPGADWTRFQGLPKNFPAFSGVRTNFRFDAPNKGADTVRDEILSSLSGTTVSLGGGSAPCQSVRSNWVGSLRTSPAGFVTTAIFTCSATYEQDEAMLLDFEDIYGGTIIAPGAFNPTDFNCEDLVPGTEGGMVDFLWVIDNSGSMADEQVNVAATANKFMATLKNSGVDWRLGVTSTEAYVINAGTGNIAHDELIDLATGLRGVGFLSAAEDNADELFTQYVAFDEGCERIDNDTGVLIAPLNSNVCGYGHEEGLESGAFVLERAEVDSRGTHQLRPDALRIVVWVSDEENQIFKPNGIDIMPSSDPAWQPIIDSYVDRYTTLGAIGFSIVGDQGNALGGVCPLLANSPSAVVGAQYGLSYVQVAEATGGSFGVVCNDDLQPTIDRIIEKAIGVASSYELSRYPIASSIRVSVDGVLIPNSRTQGWYYNASKNAITFLGQSITESSKISVAYLIWEEIGG